MPNRTPENATSKAVDTILANKHKCGLPDLVAICERSKRMEEALRADHDWRGLCDSSATETFERIAEMFYDDTGFMRPGKSEPAAFYSDEREKRRREAWDKWCTEKNAELEKQIREALTYDPLSTPTDAR